MQTEHIPLSGFFQTLCGHFIHRRWCWLALVLLVTAFFGLQMKKLRFDNSADIWFMTGHPALTDKARFDAAFGNDEFVFLMFTAEQTPFTTENFKLMAELARTLERRVPYAKRAVWLGNAERIEGREGEVAIREFMPEPPETEEEIQAKLNEALADPDFSGVLISPDRTALAMTLELNAYPPKAEVLRPQRAVTEAVDAVLAEPRFAPLAPWLTGPPVYNTRYTDLALRNMGKFFALAILAAACLLLLFGWGLRAALTPLLITGLGVFWTLGLISLLGYTLNVVSSNLPGMLICVGIADAVHLITAFHHQNGRVADRETALKDAMGEVGLAMLLTSLTTAAGFLAYLSCHVAPYRYMGVYVACGVVFTLMLTLILTPIIYSFGSGIPKRLPRADRRPDIFDRFLRFSRRLACERPGAMAIAFVSVMALTFVGFVRVEVESGTTKLIFKGQPLRDTEDMVDARMGIGNSLEFLIDTGKPSGVHDPQFMRKLEWLAQTAETHPLVTRADCVVPALKKMRRAMHDSDPAFHSLPDTSEATAQYLYLYEASGGSALDRQLGFRYDTARLTLRFPALDTAQGRELLDYMQARVDEIFGADTQVLVSGITSFYLQVHELLYEAQRHSFITATLLIALLMILVLRSFKLGLLSMIPNVFPVFFAMGLWGLIGHKLDLLTIGYAGVIIGVAVDDTIHFFTRFEQEFARLGRYEEALAATYLSVGRPIVRTTILLVAGFAMLLFSAFAGMFKLGLLFGVAFSSALLADLWFAPALIMLLKPLGPEREGEVAST